MRDPSVIESRSSSGVNVLMAQTGPSLDFGRRLTLDEWPATLLHKIVQLTSIFPQSIAAKDNLGNDISYQELINYSEAIGKALLDLGLQRGDRVALYCEPSIDSLCVLLATMYIACIYVPLDLRNPAERLETIIRDSGPSIIVCHDETIHDRGLVRSSGTGILNISRISRKTKSMSTLPIACVAEDAAFVLYTSGSTGRPKGVLLSHGNFLGQIAAMHQEVDLKNERVLQQSSLGFDTSLHQIFVALTSGGTLFIASRDIRGDSLSLSKFIQQEHITFTLAVPTEYFSLLKYGQVQLRHCATWRYAMCGGERMTETLRNGFRALENSELTLLSCYGPTEVSLACSLGIIPYSARNVSSDKVDDFVGFTLPGYSVYILDPELRPLPIGTAGEIYIGGSGVAQGYLNNQKLSDERFLADPFANDRSIKKGWTRMYKTGDQGRMLPNGALSFIGRIEGDTQIKLRGIRMELEEIAKTIVRSSHGVLQQVAVLVKGSGEHKYLLGFVVFSEQRPRVGDTYLRGLLRELPLPLYMRPAMLLPLENMPTNANGKLDRQVLAQQAIPNTQYHVESTGSMTETERRLQIIWEEILGTLGKSSHPFVITAESDFFNVGGNSILLVELQSQIHEVFGKAIQFSELFCTSILKELAARIDGAILGPYIPINWDREIEDALRSDRTPQRRRTQSDQMTVLLTGSTGFLGRHLLRFLTMNANICKVHAVAVRPHHGKDRVAEISMPSTKVKVWYGDLSQSNLGLSRAQLIKIFDTVDVVLHNGAEVSLMKTYQALRATNFGSTVTLAQLCQNGRAPFHFISSAGILRLCPEQIAAHQSSLARYTPPISGSDGYIATKWASERVLEEFAMEHGLEVHIYRPTSLVGEGSADTDIMANILHYSRLMQAVPMFPSIRKGYYNMVSVEEAAQRVVDNIFASFTQPCEHGTGPYRNIVEAQPCPAKAVQYHHLGGTEKSPAALAEYLSNQTGQIYHSLDLHVWLARAQKLGLQNSVAAAMRTPEIAQGHGILLPRFL